MAAGRLVFNNGQRVIQGQPESPSNNNNGAAMSPTMAGAAAAADSSSSSNAAGSHSLNDGRDAAGTPLSDAATERSTPDDIRTSRRKFLFPLFLRRDVFSDWLRRYAAQRRDSAPTGALLTFPPMARFGYTRLPFLSWLLPPFGAFGCRVIKSRGREKEHAPPFDTLGRRIINQRRGMRRRAEWGVGKVPPRG